MPDEFDGYVTPLDGGFEAAAGGQVGVFADEATATARAREWAAGAPCWRVDEDGTTRLLEDEG